MSGLFYVTPTGVSTQIEVYAGTQAVSDYLLSSMSDGATAFTALTPNQQAIALVAATRYMERLAWQGVPTTPAVNSTTLSWPRTGLYDQYNNAVPSSTIPQDFLNAVCELVGLIANDQTIQQAMDSGSNIESMQAGSANLKFFRPTSAQDGNATELPWSVNQLVGLWLADANPAAALFGEALGSRRSDFDGGCNCGCSPCCCPCTCGQIPCCCRGRKANVGWAL
jgi:hypothetical protein